MRFLELVVGIGDLIFELPEPGYPYRRVPQQLLAGQREGTQTCLGLLWIRRVWLNNDFLGASGIYCRDIAVDDPSVRKNGPIENPLFGEGGQSHNQAGSGEHCASNVALIPHRPCCWDAFSGGAAHSRQSLMAAVATVTVGAPVAAVLMPAVVVQPAVVPQIWVT